MKDLTQYHYAAKKAFSNYLKNNNIDELMCELYSIQSHAKAWIVGRNKHIWFRFFKGDTAATTINNIRKDLGDSNITYLRESMQICIDTGEIEIYYS